MPKDFFLPCRKISTPQLTHRFAIARDIDKTVTIGLAQETIDEVRYWVQRKGVHLIDKLFADAFNRKFPKFLAGRDITCINDFVEAHMNQTTLTPKMAEAAHWSMIECWGHDNRWAISPEQTFLVMLGIGYTINNCDKEDEKKHVFKGGSLFNMFVTLKGTKIEKIRLNGRKYHFEYPCARGVKEKMVFSSKLPMPVKTVMRHLVPDGYNGQVRLCKGHKELDDVTQDKEAATDVTQPEEAATAVPPHVTDAANQATTISPEPQAATTVTALVETVMLKLRENGHDFSKIRNLPLRDLITSTSSDSSVSESLDSEPEEAHAA